MALSEGFFRQARVTLLNRDSRFDFAANDLLEIVCDVGHRSDLERRFQTDVIDPELKRLILRVLEEAAISLEENGEGASDGVEALDEAGLTVAAPVTVAAAEAIVATARSIGSIIFLTAGLIGVISRHLARRNARDAKNFCDEATRDYSAFGGGRWTT